MVPTPLALLHAANIALFVEGDLDAINTYFAPARAKKKELLDNPDYLRSILAKGAEKARAKAMLTLDVARDRMGLKY